MTDGSAPPNALRRQQFSAPTPHDGRASVFEYAALALSKPNPGSQTRFVHAAILVRCLASPSRSCRQPRVQHDGSVTRRPRSGNANRPVRCDYSAQPTRPPLAPCVAKSPHPAEIPILDCTPARDTSSRCARSPLAPHTHQGNVAQCPPPPPALSPMNHFATLSLCHLAIWIFGYLCPSPCDPLPLLPTPNPVHHAQPNCSKQSF